MPAKALAWCWWAPRRTKRSLRRWAVLHGATQRSTALHTPVTAHCRGCKCTVLCSPPVLPHLQRRPWLQCAPFSLNPACSGSTVPASGPLPQVAHLCASIGASGCDMHACDTANAEHLQYLAEVLLSRQVGSSRLGVVLPTPSCSGT